MAFARVRCRSCPEEFLVAFSCKGRGLCPSCGAKRAAEVAAFLQDEVVQEVGHAQWVFTVPKMLRVYSCTTGSFWARFPWPPTRA